ncbi:transcription factor IIIA-like [Homarus americanus]|uniref:transcription factor IIIA-like n=1 Tax=Homarus americanus TaxID=6706 RepID=UPI001C452662|nr:transcription factor IIIA-like [Homarus americanus]
MARENYIEISMDFDNVPHRLSGSNEGSSCFKDDANVVIENAAEEQGNDEKGNKEVKPDNFKRSKIKLTETCDRTKDVSSHREGPETSLTLKAKYLVHSCTYESCEKVFSRPSRLAQHLRTHTGERPFVCPAAGCSHSYTRQQHLKRHIELGHQEDTSEENFKCEECEKGFSSAYALKKHHMRYHVLPRYKCNDCKCTFKKQQHLRTHSYVHTGLKPYKCDFPGCDSRCETPSRLKRHNLIHGKNRYACPQESCKQSFDRYKDLQYHLSISHPKVCDICGKTFRQLRQLRIHRQMHENVRVAYFCPHTACDRYFYQERNLRVHISTKHDQLKIYECGVCNKKLSTKQKLIQHTTTHGPSYKRTYTSEKPRKPRKDKGTLRRDLPRLLSGYCSDEESQKGGEPEGSESILNIQQEAKCCTDSGLREELIPAPTEKMDAEYEYRGHIIVQ